MHFTTDQPSSVDKCATLYCRANQEWQWRNILFTIVK